ncbi:MAG: acyl-CoA thioesterase [Rickettsiales bacterium]|jgi:acyl-CoA thioester hydrolase|nr:acyl-CoA thioesterase [Rickettsiales bacterium]
MKPHVFKFQIAFADTDAGGIVYHARYLEIAERARMDMFKNVRDEDGGLVIRKVSLKYLKPFRVGDIVTVETKLTGKGAASADFEQIFVKDKERHAIMNGTAVYVNKNLKPTRISDAWLKYMEI